MQLTVVFAVVLFAVAAQAAFKPQTPAEHQVVNTLRVAQLARTALTPDQQQIADDWIDVACGAGSATCLVGGIVDPLCDLGTAACAGKAIGEGLGHLIG